MPKSFIKLNKLKIGYYLFSIKGNDFFVHNLEINEKHRGKGHFKNLIKDIKQTAIKNNCQTVTLLPEYQNDISNFNSTKKLQKLYEKYGFKELINNDMIEKFYRFNF